MDFVRSHFGKMKLWPVELIFSHFWAWFLLYSANTPKSEDKYVVKVFNWSEFHLSEMTLLQNPYFNIGCPKYSKHLIFDLIWTFRILRIQDLNIFELWISVFASIRFKLRIFRISRIYSTSWIGLIFECNWAELQWMTESLFFTLGRNRISGWKNIWP